MSRLLSHCATVVLVASAGCASAKSGAAPNTAPPANMAPMMQQVVRADGSTASINVANVNAGVTTLVNAPLDSAWTALKSVYSELGIPATKMVDASHLIGNDSFKTRRRVGKMPMAKILECGSSQGMPNAETFEIIMSISSYLVTNPTAGTNLVTHIEASGKSPYFSSEGSVNCPSLGELERLIGDMVQRKAPR